MKAKDITEDGYYWRVDSEEKQIVEIDGDHWDGGKLIRFMGWDVYPSSIEDGENEEDVFFYGPFAKREQLTNQ